MKHSFYKQLEKPWPNKLLKNGVIIGHTTPTTAKIWLRTEQAGKYRLVLVPIDYHEEQQDSKLSEFLDQKEFGFTEFQSAFPESISQNVETDAMKDFIEVRDFNDLQPGTRYRYFLAAIKDEEGNLDLVVNDLPYGAGRKSEQRAGLSASFYFQTLPADAPSFSFGMFSCHNPYVQSGDEDKIVEVEGMEAWSSLAKNLHRHRSPLTQGSNDLAFVIGGGDQCYVDGQDSINIWHYLYKVMAVEDGEVYPSKEDMISWYRNIYRAYWGFPQVKTVLGMYPAYMIWDDHEIGDGWGSFTGESHPIYAKAKEKGIELEHAKELLDRMFGAAKQVYIEYQHSHNPDKGEGKLYYDFSHANAKFYVLDGRGERNINRAGYKILGGKQLRDFKQWAAKATEGEVMFVVSAVPMLHTRAWVVNYISKLPTSIADDLYDSWEHSIHTREREELLSSLWEATERGVKVCILSGDVHSSALFEMERGGRKIYQITSSAITYHLHRLQKWILRGVLTDRGRADLGARYNKLASFNRSSYAMIRVHKKGGVEVNFYDATDQIAGKDGVLNTVLSSLGSHTLWGD